MLRRLMLVLAVAPGWGQLPRQPRMGGDLPAPVRVPASVRRDCGCYHGCGACVLGYCGVPRQRPSGCNPATGTGYCTECEIPCNACGACGCDTGACGGLRTAS
eukprot:COSAG01_NODE_28698_length_655_cov_0.739209_1_plen_102_part_01